MLAAGMIVCGASLLRAQTCYVHTKRMSRKFGAEQLMDYLIESGSVVLCLGEAED
tara:strand:- start:11620 stop:11784 length:165 start_codon:yes stop_codon:yes gene_type:complete